MTTAEVTPTAERGAGPSPPGAPPPRRPPGRRLLRWLVALVFLAPALVALGALVVYPAMATIVRSFYDQAGTRYVGLENYRAMFQLERMRRAIFNSMIWVAAFPAFVVAIGLVLAVLSDRVRWKTAFKTLVFLPMAVSLLASGIIWRLMYQTDPHLGLINALIALPRELVRPTGPYAGAAPSTPDLVVGSDRSLAAAVHVGTNGAVVHIGLVRIAADKVPRDARDAVEPAAEPGRVSGVVWRDFKPGANQPGVVDPGEVGLPGVKIRLQRDGDGRVASATSGPDGTFHLSGAEPGAYHVVVSGATFRPPWEGINWLGPTLITPAAIIAAIWVWAGFSLVTIGAGLAAIDRELLEAARVDGATEWQVFRRITVPLLGPVLGVVFITMTINALKMFDLVFAIAPGSSQDKADVIALEMWRTAFTGAGNRGLGSAIAVFLFVLVLPVLAFNIRRFRLEESRR